MTTLAPQEELKIVYNLNNFYDFKAKGKYLVAISRKVSKQGKGADLEIPLGATIEVELK